MAASSVGKTITLGGVLLNVKASKELSDGVEYYTLQPSTPKAKAVNYVRSTGAYNRTVFSQAQFENFFKTGKVSSFGTPRTTTVNGTTLTYVTKDGSTALFLAKPGAKAGIMYEYQGPAAMLANDNGQPPGMSNDTWNCIVRCYARYYACDLADMDGHKSMTCTVGGRSVTTIKCICELDQCLYGCQKGTGGGGIAIQPETLGHRFQVKTAIQLQ